MLSKDPCLCFAHFTVHSQDLSSHMHIYEAFSSRIRAKIIFSEVGMGWYYNSILMLLSRKSTVPHHMISGLLNTLELLYFERSHMREPISDLPSIKAELKMVPISVLLTS